ncbi:MAG TPA: hypothetical protein VJJ23_06670 [Candidatus Nanoarchaeia archaeon]|nr:hypothetical protein [Candidatus Nanoarchaeia archaeon]
MNQNKKRRIFFSLTIFIVFLAALFLVQKFSLATVTMGAFPTYSNISTNNTNYRGTGGVMYNLSKNGEQPLFNITIMNNGPDPVYQIYIRVPTDYLITPGTNITFYNTNLAIAGARLNDSNVSISSNATDINISFVKSLPNAMNLTSGSNLTFNTVINVTQITATENAYIWQVILIDNASTTTDRTMRTLIDGLAPRVSNVNATDGTYTKNSGDLNNRSHLKGHGGYANISITATIADMNLNPIRNSSVRLVMAINHSGAGSLPIISNGNGYQGTFFKVYNMSTVSTHSPYIYNVTIPTGLLNGTNHTSFFIVVNDSLGYQTNETNGGIYYNFTIDDDNPNTPTVTPTPSSTTTNNAVSVACSGGGDPTSNTVTYSISVTKPSGGVLISAINPYQFTDTSATGTYTITCTAADSTGHSTTSSSGSFTVTYDGGGGGGGGGGGSGGSSGSRGTVPSLAESSTAQLTLNTGEAKILELGNSLVQSVTLAAGQKIATSIKVEGIPAPSVAGYKIIQAFKLETSITRSMLSSNPTITFTCPENGKKISLLREESTGKWNSYPATRLGSGKCQATVPGFSNFAVAEEATPVTQPTKAPTTQPAPVQKAPAATTAIIIVIIIIVIIILLIVAMTKKKGKK